MKTLYRPFILRSIATFLLVEMLTQVCMPSISYALTSGPTAPEATSFEPVDTTDMVDLASGDFTYTIPLLEVPGPEGGYPLALSYHAGIQPNEEASWVGLGWSLNPGAINRNVNGYADDHENVAQTRRDVWVGGNQSTTSVGVTVGIAETPASVSFGLSFSQDTYRGFGVGAYASVGVQYEVGAASINANVSVSTDGYGHNSAGIGVGVGTSLGGDLTGSIGVSANTSGGFGADAGLSIKGQSLMGVSMSSGSSSPSFSVAGGSATIENGRAGVLQTEVSSTGITFPVYYGVWVSLRQSDVRYWSDETVDVSTNGSLYFPKQYLSNAPNASQTIPFDNIAFDTYRLLDPEHENVYDNPDPNWLQGGSYPDYDNYEVSAQGLGGSMRPYCYQEALYSQNKVQGTGGDRYKIVDYPLPWVNKPAFFRFENDFSNQYRQGSTGGLTSGPYTYGNQTFDEVRYNFDTQPIHGDNSSIGYDNANDRIAGSKSVEYFTNADIVSGQAKARGFIDQVAKGFVRDNNSQIGGFSITNASGVTYHYSLPVYASNETVYMEQIGSNGGTFTQLNKGAKYAYTWYLTAVTGPDYVDYNNDGLANGSDWGYWTTFNYGKWVESYRWRNPSEGFHRDADASFQDYSSGLKQLYYLNTIATRTHTALFVKSIREDGKSSIWSSAGKYSIVQSVGCTPTAGGGCRDAYSSTSYPSPQLKLDKIVTLKNDDVPANVENSASLYNIANFSFVASNVRYTSTGRALLGANVIDEADISSIPSLNSNSLNSVLFSYNYSLSPKTTNSWVGTLTAYTNSPLTLSTLGSPPQLTGKLSLLQTQTFGQGGRGAMPATKFGYELTPGEKVSGTVQVGSVTNSKGVITLPANSPLQGGDIIEFTANSQRITCALVPQASGGLLGYYFGGVPTQIGDYRASITKNPTYSKDHYDKWGMFKSDFDIDLAQLAGHDETMARTTSALSARNTDVWSLRRIKTPLGAVIAINYGSDTYGRKIIQRPNMVTDFGSANFYSSSGAIGDGPGYGHITFDNRLKVPASSLFRTNQRIMVSGIMSKSFVDASIPWAAVNDIAVTVTGIVDQGPGHPANVISIRDDSNILFQPHPDYYSSQHIGLSPYRPIIMGHIKFDENPELTYGGGVRVEQLSVLTSSARKTTSYSYSNNGLPSGVTSYEPGSYLPMNKANYDYLIRSWPDATAAANSYKNSYYNKMHKILALARTIPGPGVMYEFVTAQDIIKHTGETELVFPQKTLYQFEVLKDNMIDLVGKAYSAVPHTNTNQYPTANYEVRTREVAIEDFTSRVGKLKRRTTYDANGAKLNETVNHFLHDDLNNASLTTNASTGNDGYAAKMAQFGYVGMVQETFGDARWTQRSQGVYDTKVVMSHRNTYPVVLTGTTSTDYKTNITTTTDNKQFDFLSGQVTAMLSTDGYGNKILSESKPAYRVYSALGPKMGTNGGRNMLTQTAANTQYKVDAQGNKTGVISATANTWVTSVPVLGTTPSTPETRGTQATIWRPQSTYSWQPATTTANGLTPMTGTTGYVDFFAGVGSPSWRKTSEVTLYDVYSNALEASDINGKYVATKKGYDQSRVLMTGGPATYNEIVYTGLEDAIQKNGTLKRNDGYLSGGVSLAWPTWDWNSGNATVISGSNLPAGSTHTGTSSLQLKPNKHGLSYEVPTNSIQPNKAYRVSVWTNQLGGQVYYWVNGVERAIIGGNAQKNSNGWYLLDLTIPPIGAGNTLRVGCYNSGPANASFDDFRFQPIDAQCSAYVYDGATGKLTDLLDNNNLYTHYQYDAEGRLQKVFRETFKYNIQPVSEYSYQYGPTNALDNVALTVSNPVNRTVQVTVSLPSSLSNSTIQYSPGGTVAYATASGPAFSHTFTSAGTYWLKVRVTDGVGKQRELVSKVVVP